MNSLQKKAIEEAQNLIEKARCEISRTGYEKYNEKRKTAIDEAIGQAQNWFGRVLESEAT